MFVWRGSKAKLAKFVNLAKVDLLVFYGTEFLNSGLLSAADKTPHNLMMHIN